MVQAASKIDSRHGKNKESGSFRTPLRARSHYSLHDGSNLSYAIVAAVGSR
jgi:hypothetical protein